MNANSVEDAIIQKASDQVLTRDYLSDLLEEVRRSFNIESLDTELVEGR